MVDIPSNALLQASVDVVIGADGKAYVVDFNRFQEGYSVHLLNKREAVEAAFVRETQALLGGQRVHIAGSTSWPELNFGTIYDLTLKYLVGLAGAEETTVAYGLGGMDVNKGAFTFRNEPTQIFYYRDFEAMSNREKLDSDLRKLFRIMNNTPELEPTLTGSWVNWPTACWCPANMQLNTLMTKSGLYGKMKAAGLNVPDHIVINDREEHSIVREKLAAMLEQHGTVVAKPDKVGGRAVGVTIIRDRADIDNFVDGLGNTNLENWLIEGSIPRHVVTAEGKNVIFDLIPLVIGLEAVSTNVKYSFVRNGVIEKMPGVNPAIFVLPGIEGRGHLEERAEYLIEMIGFQGKDRGLHDLAERRRQFGAIEGDEADELRAYFRNGQGKKWIDLAEDTAVRAKKVLLHEVKRNMPGLRDDLQAHINSQRKVKR
ncbi:MAG: hypothetical protein KGH69_01595 [Candidatus Micrarchaeota archaeon]|nr:hypothetical protein [Candidatus Micrarchaeota archaeon]